MQRLHLALEKFVLMKPAWVPNHHLGLVNIDINACVS